MRRKKEKDPADESDDEKEGEDPEVFETSAKEDATATFDYVARAVAGREAELKRGLVHLIDVHRSVQGSLDKSKPQKSVTTNYYNRRKRDDRGGLDPEEKESKEDKVKAQSALKMWALGIDWFGDDPY